MTARKSPSLKALEEIKDTLIKQVREQYSATSVYTGDGYTYYAKTQAHNALEQRKQEVIDKISKEVEAYAVKTYAKYGLISVPLCHRKDGNGGDRLEIDLKVKKFPEAEILQQQVNKIDAEFATKLKKVDEWYYAALRSVAARQELPEPPTF